MYNVVEELNLATYIHNHVEHLRLYRNIKGKNSEFLENHEEMFTQNKSSRFKSSSTLYCVTRSVR